jgi:alpha-tubulin suppressor-like RCC1 family protein
MKRLILLLALVALSGCDRDPVEPEVEPGRVLSIVSGDEQEAPAGFPLASALTVRATSTEGLPLPGVEILWQVIEGGGGVNAFRTFTDSAGMASVHWTLGDVIGPQLVFASAAGTSGVTFRARSDLFFTSVTTGWRHTCGLDPRGRAWCWGDNTWGQLGSGSRTASVESRRVSGSHSFTHIEAGMLHSCALTETGAAYCWGDNGTGQLGDGTTVHSTAPVPVLGGHNFRKLALGYAHTCGITEQRELYCWGSDMQGQTGVSNGERCTAAGVDALCSRLPRRVALPGVALAVATGEAHSCAADGQERVYCWGLNDWGQLGIGHFGGGATAPTQVAGDVRLRDLTAWGRTTCGLDARGAAFCWGMNAGGKLGIGSLLNLDRPLAVEASGTLFVEIAIGDNHGCGRTDAGMIYCWGTIPGGSTPVSLVPAAIGTDRIWSSLSTHGGHACAYSEGVWCWGSNAYGQLGVDKDAVATAPTPLLVRRGPPAHTGS